MNRLKRIALVTTGGTIAGVAARSDDTTAYTAGALGPEALLAAIPQLGTLADIVPEALYAIDSKDITPAHWLLLARRADALLRESSIDGIVITHGTDTMEESAYFLHLTLPKGKPVIFTGAMRPATALSADGPMNLYQAVAVAASAITRELGVVVVMNGEIHGARAVRKTHTLALSALSSPNGGPLGRSDPPSITTQALAQDAHTFPLESLKLADPLPEVALLTVASGVAPFFLQAAGTHFAGLVLALPGHGSLPDLWRAEIDALITRKIPLVRASRTGAGPVLADKNTELWPSGDLSPEKARIGLILAIASGNPTAFNKLIAQ